VVDAVQERRHEMIDEVDQKRLLISAMAGVGQ
jgi:hypothetical protein